MTTTLAPYISFPGNAREAITFYSEVFGGTPEIASFGQFNAVPEDHPAADKVMHGALSTDVLSLYVSDYIEGMGQAPVIGNNVTLALMGDDEELLRGWWDALSAEGTVNMPLEAQVWGDVYGDVTDKFGIEWQFNISEPA